MSSTAGAAEALASRLAGKDLLLRDLFGKALPEIAEILGEPTEAQLPEGSFYGHAIWRFADYEVEAQLNPLEPRIHFISFAPRQGQRLEGVLRELKLDEPNLKPRKHFGKGLRWSGYVAQGVRFEKVTWWFPSGSGGGHISLKLEGDWRR